MWGILKMGIFRMVSEKLAQASLNFAKMSIRKLQGSSTEKSLSEQEQLAKINDVRKILGPVADKLPVLCSDASISRYLRARNWNTKKAAKMLKNTLKWRLEFKPEKIRWEDIAKEAETGKVYRANYLDKKGRTVLIFRPGFQNTSDIRGQIRHLVYCMENATTTLNPDQDQMVWLIDFQGWTMSCISVKAARETAHILQNHYPERLGVGILYNPPKVFESFWTVRKNADSLYSIVNIFLDNGTNVWNYETNPINFVFVPVVSNLVHLVIPCGLYNDTSPMLTVIPKFTKLAFLQLVKPFIEPKTYKKVRFVYSNGPQSQKLMEELFDMDKLDCAFGGRNSAGFNHEAYAQWMREDDKKKFDMMNCGSSSPLPSIMSESQSSETLTPSGISVASDEDDSSSGDEKTINLENIDEKTQDLPLSCEDVAVSEAEDVAVSEAVDVGKELKKGELA
ncbi:hypothetical protein POTOM_045361 [Populus tomentosa]|uniref:CRAL-TRIO domain-containing protein n=1 Tax=Populus tomentosa TaxID=118781 RepID=A0A8X8C6Q1_POPTO|nr:hypothetical protein POTOM_045361 [Populus tomentosa]